MSKIAEFDSEEWHVYSNATHERMGAPIWYVVQIFKWTDDRMTGQMIKRITRWGSEEEAQRWVENVRKERARASKNG